MPSDPRISAVLATLEAVTSDFRAALAATAADVQRFLAAEGGGQSTRREQVAAEFGVFGARYLDTDRMAGLLVAETPVAAVPIQTVERALDTLRELESQGDALFSAAVTPPDSLRDTVESALAAAGRAFGAARVVQSIRSQRYRLGDHARSLGAFPLARWSRAEREHAPPLVVEVSGDDLRAAALDEFLDGTQKIVLVVTGRTSPVPLVRLIGPGVFVQQANTAEALERLATFAGPGIAALVPEGAARFTHDPSGVDEDTPALRVDELPPVGPRAPVGGLSAAQQNQEIRLLESLAATPVVPGPAVKSAEERPAEPADKLAAWLLNRVDLEEMNPPA